MADTQQAEDIVNYYRSQGLSDDQILSKVGYLPGVKALATAGQNTVAVNPTMNVGDPSGGMAGTPDVAQDNAQLSVWMQIAGKDPNDPQQVQQFIADAGANAQADPTNHQQEALDTSYANPQTAAEFRNRAYGGVQAAGATNQTAIDKLGALGADTTAKNQASLAGMRGLVDAQGTSDADYINKSNALNAQLGGYANTANAFDWSQLQNYQTGLSGLTDSNNSYVSGLGSTYASMPQLQSTLQANQLASQAAQAYANAGDVANQQSAARALQGIANGSKDVDFYSLPGISDLKAAYNGSQDVHSGDEDPAAYAAQQDALAEFKSRSDPRVTDAERFLYEQSRRAQEQDERNNRSAVMTNLRQRGLSGASSEIADAAIGGQRASNDRLLADLGANAQAVARAENDLQNYGGLASTMTGQANDLAKTNANNRLQALGQYTGIGADVNTGNMNRQATGQQAASAAYSDLRQQGFDESYKRGTAADAMSQFNENNRVDVQKYNQNYASSERDAAAQRAQSLANTGLNANQLNALNLTNSNTAATNANNATYGRNKDVLGAQNATNTNQQTLSSAQTDRRLGLGSTDIGLNNDAFAKSQGITNLGIGNTTNTALALANLDSGRSTQVAGDQAAATAAELARQQAEHDSSFRFGLGGDRGLLGGNLIAGIL